MLSVETLDVAYGKVTALRGLSLEVAERELVTVIGANGAGKSTLLRAIAGVLRPAAGTIRVDGEITSGRSSEHMVKRGVAMVPEGRHVFPELTVVENLELGAYYRRDRGDIGADLDRVFRYFPVLVDRRRAMAGALSGGQQQMLAIGRALMSRPRLLLLDEPSLGLAPLIVREMAAIIQELNRAGTTILLVEQNARMALKLADRAYVMATGRIVKSGTGRELLDDTGVQDTYLGGRSR